MAIISMFYGIIISMYYLDKKKHNEPHIHVKYQEQEAVVKIPDGEILEGEMKPNKMNPRVKYVKPKDNYKLILTFTNGEIKIFDVKPYLGIGIFQELYDVHLFNSVKPFLGSIQWQNGQDLCLDTLYMESKSTS